MQIRYGAFVAHWIRIRDPEQVFPGSWISDTIIQPYFLRYKCQFFGLKILKFFVNWLKSFMFLVRQLIYLYLSFFVVAGFGMGKRSRLVGAEPTAWAVNHLVCRSSARACRHLSRGSMSGGSNLGKNNYLCTCDLHGPVCNAFDAGSIHYKGKWEGVGALEIETFLGPVKSHRADRRVPFGAKFAAGIESITALVS